MKTYTIMAGVNGAEKSSLAGVLWEERDDLGMIIDANKLAASCNRVVNMIFVLRRPVVE